MINKDTILRLLREDKRAVARALVVLYERQTYDEKAQEGTRHQNGRGFRPCHARMGSSMAKQFIQRGTLSDKQINYWRVCDKTGAMRIGIYWAQLLEEAELKQKQKQLELSIGAAGSGRDYGNDMERRAILEEMYGDVLDSDDPALYGPLKDEIDEIDAFWEKLKNKQGM